MTIPSKYAWARWVGYVEPSFITDVIVEWRSLPYWGYYAVYDFCSTRASNYYIYKRNPISHGLYFWHLVPLVPI